MTSFVETYCVPKKQETQIRLKYYLHGVNSQKKNNKTVKNYNLQERNTLRAKTAIKIEQKFHMVILKAISLN